MLDLQPSTTPSASVLKTTRANQSAGVVRSRAYPPALPPSFLSAQISEPHRQHLGRRPSPGPLSALSLPTSSSLLPPALSSSQPKLTAHARPLICTHVAECRDPWDPCWEQATVAFLSLPGVCSILSDPTLHQICSL